MEGMEAREAAQFGDIVRLSQLLDQGAVTADWVDQDDCSLLHWAAINNRLPIADLVISRGCNVNAIGGVLRSTPLHWAARQGYLRMVALLVCRGADTEHRDVEGFTALHVAAQFGKTPVVAYLIARGQAVDATDVSMMTPLMWTVSKVLNTETLDVLLTLGADVRRKDAIYHNTPLHWAAVHGNYIAAKALLKADVDVAAVNKENETALDVARRRGDVGIVRLIEKEARKRGIAPTTFVQRLVERPVNARRCLSFLPFITFLTMCIILHLAVSVAFKFVLIFAYSIINFFIIRRFSPSDFNAASPVAFAFAIKVALILSWVAYLHSISPWYLQICFSVLLFVLPFVFIRVCLLDPGVIMTTYQEKCKTIVQISEGGEQNLKFCHTCLILRPPRSKHCRECNMCMRRFDHHCPWLNTCVAENNNRTFVCYLALLVVSLVVYIAGLYNYVRSVCAEGDIWEMLDCNHWLLFTFVVTLPSLGFAVTLLVQQLYQIALNITTNERLNIKRYTHFTMGSHCLAIKSPFSNGVWRNYCDFFCGQAEAI